MKNSILLSAFLLIYPLALGTTFLYAIYGSFARKKLTLADGYLAGGIISIGLAEISHLVSGYLGWSFSGCTTFLCALLVIAVGIVFFLALISFLVRKRGRSENRGDKSETLSDGIPYLTSAEYILFLVWACLFAGCIARILLYSDFSLYKDLTPELTSTFLHTNRLFAANPTTGMSYTTAVPSRFQVLCLPTLYGALCTWFQMEVGFLCFRVMPVAVFVMACLAYSSLGRAFWPTCRQNRILFQIVILVLFFVSDTIEGQTGFQLFHQGFSPQTIRVAVLLPFLISLLLRKRYGLILLPILAETCLVWTNFGVSWCFLTAFFWIAIEKFGKALMARKGGKT